MRSTLKVPSFVGLAVCLIALGISPVRADEQEFPSSELWVFGGLQVGLSDLGVTSITEASKGGWNLGIKAIASKYTPQWVFDLGFGWFHDQQSASSSGSSVKVITNAGFLDVCPRYRLTSHWQ